MKSIKAIKHDTTQTDIKSNGVVIYDGPSLLNGDPIVGIITGVTVPSKNPKTGDMLQLWVLPRDVHPNEIKQDDNHPSCGNCPLKKGICYVNATAYGQVYKVYKSGKYPFLTEHHLQLFKSRQRKIRLSAYGESTAIPLNVIKPILRSCNGFTGYTHTWNTCDPEWSQYLMASVETDALARQAANKQWRYFKIVSEEYILQDNEKICPNYLDPQKNQCEACQLCNGHNEKSFNNTPNIVTPIHGSGKRVSTFLQRYGH